MNQSARQTRKPDDMVNIKVIGDFLSKWSIKRTSGHANALASINSKFENITSTRPNTIEPVEPLTNPKMLLENQFSTKKSVASVEGYSQDKELYAMNKLVRENKQTLAQEETIGIFLPEAKPPNGKYISFEAVTLTVAVILNTWTSK